MSIPIWRRKMTKKSYFILVVAMLIVTMMSVMLFVMIEHAHDTFEDRITVSANGVTESVIPVRNLALNPGLSKEYQVNLVCMASGHFLINLDYEETHDGGMKHFINVKVLCDGKDEPVYYGPLTDLLDKDVTIDFDSDLYEKDPIAIKFIYEMPITIGNEAQGTSADFDIHLSVEKS